MRPQVITLFLSVGAFLTASLSIPNGDHALSRRETVANVQLLDSPLAERFDNSLSYLEKRRGGGGSSSGGGRSGGSSSGSSSSGAGAGSSSGARPSYGGGRYYGGGSTSAYSAGARSPLGITPYLLGGAALGIFPGLWLYGAYAYPYSHPYSFVNRTDTNSSNPNGANQTLPVTCLCQQYNPCGCDDNGNTTYVGSLLGNGSVADLDTSLVNVGPVNGTKTVVINGTLPNDTADSTSTTSAAGKSGPQTLLENSGFWVVGAIVAYSVWFM